MRTIDNIKKYHLTRKETESLIDCEIINGCGGKGGVNIDDLINYNLSTLDIFDESKKDKLLEDLKVICYEHDIDFRFRKGLVKSNYKMACKVYRLLHWIKFSIRISIALGMFISLNKYGKKFYYIKKGQGNQNY